MSVTDEQAEYMVKELRKVSKEEFEYGNGDTFWSLLAADAADVISDLLLRKTIKTYLHEGSKKV